MFCIVFFNLIDGSSSRQTLARQARPSSLLALDRQKISQYLANWRKVILAVTVFSHLYVLLGSDWDF